MEPQFLYVANTYISPSNTPHYATSCVYNFTPPYKCSSNVGVAWVVWGVSPSFVMRGILCSFHRDHSLPLHLGVIY
ncbi:hypothetical protein XELAEV_18030649mg [Xenopus laevis]|uniref:Uncharacterized protein n=1 Tax=Xenopus laevis TaxID=8355 RepID=A0A974HEX3_XENLA|nr:hypothetical protein XELAEV_18030649mg [Xenopus laevis]